MIFHDITLGFGPTLNISSLPLERADSILVTTQPCLAQDRAQSMKAQYHLAIQDSCWILRAVIATYI